MLAWNLTGWVRFLLFFVPWCGLPFTTKTFLLNWLLCRDSFSSWIIDRVCDFPSWNCLNQSKKHACLSQITFIGSLQIGKADNKSFPCVCQAYARSGVIFMAKTIPNFRSLLGGSYDVYKLSLHWKTSKRILDRTFGISMVYSDPRQMSHQVGPSRCPIL